MARNTKSKRQRAPKTVLKLPDLEQSKSAVLNTLTSPSSQRSYDHAIREFIDWYCSEPRLAFNKTVVTRYGISLEQRHYAPSTINLRLAGRAPLGLRGFRLRPLEPRFGCRNWKGKGCSPAWRSHRQLADGRRRQTHDRRIWFISSKTAQEPRHDRCFNRMRLRRAEAAALKFEDVQLREEHWVIADLNGKGGHIRTVPMPNWVKTAIDEWAIVAGINSGPLFRAINKAGRVWGN